MTHDLGTHNLYYMIVLVVMVHGDGSHPFFVNTALTAFK